MRSKMMRPDVSGTDPSSEVNADRGGEVHGILTSGGLDSCILLKHALDGGWRVKPFYIYSGLFWQRAERDALGRFLDAVAHSRLEPLAILDLPLADVYGDHWSVSGRGVPAAGTPDEATFLPGRNVLLTIKAALWCQMHGIGDLSIGTLRSNPFPDASDDFFQRLEAVLAVLSAMQPTPIRLRRPFGDLDKQQVMELGRRFPLELTFSCIAPRGSVHCGRCNKCDERQAAFRLIGERDPTEYAAAAEIATASDRHPPRKAKPTGFR